MKKIVSFFLAIILFFTVFPLGNQAKAAGNYKDISSNHWAAKDIEYLSNKGVIGGFKDRTFKPNVNVTKAQASIMIVRALGLNTNNVRNPSFSDVGNGSTAYNYIAAMVEQGYFYKTPKFYPDHALIRFEMARIMANAFNLTGDKTSRFSDVKISNTYYSDVDALSYNNITVGFPGGTFKGNEPLTRAQFSVFLARAMKVGTPDKQAGKTAPEPMKDITFGMTYQQVKNKETRELSYDYYNPKGASYLNYNAEKYKVETELVYGFDYDKLATVWYDFNPQNDYGTVSDLREIYYSLQTLLVYEYGDDYFYKEPIYTYLIDSSSLWTVGNYQVMLYVRNTDGESRISISYHPINYSGANVNGENKNQVIDSLIKQIEKHEKQVNK